MAFNYSVISIGALSRNRFWKESAPKRVSHSTTVLIRDKTTTILVDPGLPAQVLAQRLEERAGLTPEQIDMVFLTTFRPVHRRSLAMFSQASWVMNQPEIQAMQANLEQLADQNEADTDELGQLLLEERSLLARIQPAPDKLTPCTHLFPTPGVTPGSAGLLLTALSWTIVVAGDAIVSRDYLEAGQVFEQVHDLEAAQESFSDVLEIADEVVCGHDNKFVVRR